GGKAELEIGAARIRLDSGTELDIDQLDDQTIHLSVPQGRIDVALKGSRMDEHYEIETPRGDVTLVDGRYRVDAGTQQDATRIAAFTGTAEIDLNNQQTTVGPGQEASAGPDEPPSYTLASAALDEFDAWADQRDGAIYARAAPPGVPQVPGSDTLAEYGSWHSVPDYGQVWTPADVASDWTPYSDGRWSWVAPWGWTWVDAAPWGFAPFHYGRWVQLAGVWSWVPVAPGVVIEPGFVPIYAPALVAFLGDPLALVVGFGGGPVVGWVPLGPGEFWQPWFPVGFEYVRRVNVVNVNRTRINNLTVNNYRTIGANQTLANARAARVVPTSAFASGRPVQTASLAVNRAAVAQAAPAADPAATHLPSPARTAMLTPAPARGAPVHAGSNIAGRVPVNTPAPRPPASVFRPPATSFQPRPQTGLPLHAVPQSPGVPRQVPMQPRGYGPPPSAYAPRGAPTYAPPPAAPRGAPQSGGQSRREGNR
ncbi:MAG TPA: DUF6600 domain-containing protein, partial [Stellaceae bacterium]|nr:DUF6600 domain-containing protein [Stellaceae bacterium]